MKLKKGIKKIFVIVLIIILIILLILFIKNNFSNTEPQEIKIINKIEKYDYKLKENKSKKYKKLFKELKQILNKEEINEEEYVKKITEMFIVDFYSLNDKRSQSDVGGVDFVLKDARENFLLVAEDTYYKYLESNIYDNRNQSLPEVDEVKIDNVTINPYSYGEKVDDKAYLVKVSWNYTENEFSSYQKNATLVFVHEDNKLCLIELQK